MAEGTEAAAMKAEAREVAAREDEAATEVAQNRTDAMSPTRSM